MKTRLRDLAAVIRSKNSGPYELTLDIIFKDRKTFERIVSLGVINKLLVAKLYSLKPEQVLSVINFAPSCAIKATIVRPCGSGDLGERDVYGAQQHAPLMNLEFDL